MRISLIIFRLIRGICHMLPSVLSVGDKVVITLAAYGIIRVFLFILRATQNWIVEHRSSFELSGYWIARYKDLRTPESDADHREIVRLRQKGESLFFRYEHHNSSNSVVTKGDGQGFVRINEAFLYYKRQNMQRGSGGVIILSIILDRIRMPHLDGAFIEHNRSTPGESFITVPYRLRQVKLPFHKRLKMLCGKQVFTKYVEITRLETDQHNELE
jgi:hypothetical protein